MMSTGIIWEGPRRTKYYRPPESGRNGFRRQRIASLAQPCLPLGGVPARDPPIVSFPEKKGRDEASSPLTEVPGLWRRDFRLTGVTSGSGKGIAADSLIGDAEDGCCPLAAAMLGGSSGDGERDTDDDAAGAVAAPPAIDFPAEVSDPKYDGETGKARAVPGLAVHLGSSARVVPKSHPRPQAASGLETRSRTVEHREAEGGRAGRQGLGKYLFQERPACERLYSLPSVLRHFPEAAFHLHALAACYSSFAGSKPCSLLG